MRKIPPNDLPWTGERYVTQLKGDIELEHKHRYALACELSKGKRVLDIACGEGYGSEMLSRRAKSVVGVDIDPATVAHAIKKYHSPKMRFLEGACEKIPLPDKSVDLVVSFETLEHFEDHDKFLGEIERVLDSGGILVISTPEKSAYSDKPKHANPFHKKELYREQFLRLLSQKYGHMIYFEQKVTFGSCLVAPKDQTMGFSSFQLNERIMANSKRNGLKDAVYLVAVCSKAPLPELAGSLYEDRIWKRQLEENFNNTNLANLEIFYSQKRGDFSEKRKITRIIKKGGRIREEIILAMKDPAKQMPYWRLDPGCQSAKISLLGMKFLDKEGRVLWDLQHNREQIVVSGTAVKLSVPKKGLELLSTGHDPIILMPPLPPSALPISSIHVDIEISSAEEGADALVRMEKEKNTRLQQALAEKDTEAIQLKTILMEKNQQLRKAEKIDALVRIEKEKNKRLQQVLAEKGTEVIQLKTILTERDQQLRKAAENDAKMEQIRQEIMAARGEAKTVYKSFDEKQIAADSLQTLISEKYEQLSQEQKMNESKIRDLGDYASEVQKALASPLATLIPAPFSWYGFLYSILKITGPKWLEDRKTLHSSKNRPGFWRRLERSIRKRRKRWIAGIGFDRDWYLKNYPDVAKASIDPLEHYLFFGKREGRYKNSLMSKDQVLDRAYFPYFRQEDSKQGSKVVGILPERLTDGSLSPCAYIRLLLPLHFLAETSKDYRVEILDENSIFLKKPDIVICQRFWCQEQHLGNRILGEIKRRGIKVIYDLDDDLLSVTNNHADQQLIKERASLVLSMLSYCDLAVFSTSYLEEKYRPLCRNAIVIPNRLGKQIWGKDNSVPYSKQNETIRILYMGTATHDIEVDFLNLVVSRIKNAYGSRVSFVMVGGTNSETKSAGWDRRIPPVNSTTNYPAFARWLLSQSWDIALSPQMDTEFNRGKSAIKLMDYSALGVPIVASSHSEYMKEFPDSLGVSLLPNDVESWVQKITFLIENEKERIYQGNQNRQNFDKNLTLEKAENNWEKGLRYLSNLPLSNEKKLEVYDFEISGSPKIDRKLLSSAFINGKGIEIRALHNPLSVAPGVEVSYLDHLGKTDLYDHYPELREHDLVEVDIIDNGETLKNVASSSQDFIIANHFIEHCEDPILALKNIFRALKTFGVLYMAVPDKRFTFDIDREETSMGHLWEDHLDGAAKSRKVHYYEWAKFVERHNGTLPKDASNETIIERASYLERKNYSIHFHVWCCQSFLNLLEELRKTQTVSFNYLFSGSFPSRQENIFILQKET